MHAYIQQGMNRLGYDTVNERTCKNEGVLSLSGVWVDHPSRLTCAGELLIPRWWCWPATLPGLNFTLTFKALHTGHPPYLADLLQYHKTTKSTRSSASHLLSVPRHNLSFGSRAFRISAPKIWNSLPHHILQSQTLDSVRRHLKTYYFQSAYPAP